MEGKNGCPTWPEGKRVNVFNECEDSPKCKKPNVIVDGQCVPTHTDRPDNTCAFNPGQGRCAADCTTDHSFCSCPRGFIMNENDHCRPDKPCPRGFEEHTNDETGTCFPTKALLKKGFHGGPIICNNINIRNSLSASASASAAATATTTTGFNQTFWNATTPYCWYVVNVPLCFDTRTGQLNSSS